MPRRGPAWRSERADHRARTPGRAPAHEPWPPPATRRPDAGAPPVFDAAGLSVEFLRSLEPAVARYLEQP